MSARGLVRWIKIEAAGDVTSGRCWRFSTQPYAGDSDAVYVPGLLDKPWDPIPTSWDPRAQGAGRATIGGTSIRMVARSSVLTKIYNLTRPARVGILNATITAASSSLVLRQLASTNFAGLAISLGREVIRLDSRTGVSGSLHTYAITRGLYETTATGHSAAADRDTSALLWTFPNPLLRTVTLGYSPMTGSGYGDEVVTFRGVLRAVELSGAGAVLVLQADAALELVRARRLGGDLWRARQTYRSEGDEVEAPWQVTFGADDPRRRPSYTDGPGLFRVGDRVAYDTWGVYEAPGGDTRAQVQINDDTRPGPSSAPLTWTDASEADEIWEVFTSHPAAPDINASATATKARLSSHPVTLARQILTTTGAVVLGNPGDNGEHDLGVRQLGCGVPAALLDASAWDEAESAPAPLASSFWLGLDGNGAEALGTIQTLLALAGWTMIPTAAGLLTLTRLRSAAASPDHTLSGALQVEVQSQRPRLGDPADELVCRWADSPAGARERTFQDAAILERQLGQGAQRRLDLSALQDPDEVQSAAIREIRLWRYAMHQVEARCLLTPDSEGITPGETGLLTSLAVVSGTGVRGVTSELCQVLAATASFDEATVDLSLLMVGALHNGQARRIAPSALVVALPGAGVVEVDITYSGTPAPGQTDDLFGFAVGDVVRFSSRDGSTVHGTATITALTPATPSFTVNAVPGGAGVGSLVEPATYDAASSAQRAAWAYLADATDTLGAGGDAAHEWTV